MSTNWIDFIQRKRTSNPLFPLPDDYDQLTPAGQCEARLSILRDQSTPEKLVLAWDLFRRLYLKPMGQSFYRGGFVESPSFHYDTIYDLGSHARNALAAPRGTAKSTVIGAEVPLFLVLTRPYFPIALCLPTDKLVESRFDILITQLTTNPLILEDFGIQKPMRGQAIWNHHHLHLNNGSVIEGFSVMGRKRGARPQLFVLDDPENDPESESQTSAELVLEKFEKTLFRQIIPMLEHKSAIFWVGTLINRRSFLYRAVCMEDSRFQFWNRRLLEAIRYDGAAKDKVSVLWNEKWPQEVLEARRSEIGDAAFSAEYMNDPISETERVLTVKPRRNEYVVTPPPDTTIEFDYRNDPFNSRAELVWYKRISDSDSYEEQKQPFGEWVKGLFKVTAVDYATGLTQFNDYSCIITMGFDTLNILWVLDMWMGRVSQTILTKQIYGQARRWQVKAIGVEAVSMQVWFADAVQLYVETQPDAWKPRVLPIRYPHGVSKADRIAGLEPRFSQGNVKYPAHLSDTFPWTHLYSQTRDFTLDLALLNFDDAIDTLAMSQYIVHARGVQPVEKGHLEPNRLQRLERGQPLVRGMQTLLTSADLNTLTPDELQVLLDKHYGSGKKNNNRKFQIDRPSVIG